MTTDMIITVLVWASLALGALVLSMLTWFALRIIHQLDKVTDLLGEQHADFKGEMHKQREDFKGEMTKQREDFKSEMHDHDLRIARMEAWRDLGINRTPREPLADD